jgi:hypothetical protein
MDLAQAIQKANNILNEERVLPTVTYIDPVAEWMADVNKRGKDARLTPEAVKAMKDREKTNSDPHFNLYHERSLRPRIVHESPYQYVFRSVNFDLLRILFGQIQECDRGLFVAGLLARISGEKASKYFNKDEARFPCYHRFMSELPLVAEFCVRLGHSRDLIEAVSKAEKPTIGLIVLMLELEEMIALNFNRFSDQELGTLTANLMPLYRTCEKIEKDVRDQATVRGVTVYSQESRELRDRVDEIKASIGGISEECRKAQYFYLKGSLLQEMPNLEIEGDKTRVISFLDSLGFNPQLSASLNRAEELYRNSSDAFDLKDCLGNIRTFYEHLNRDAGQALAKSVGTTVANEWDPTLTFFKNSNFFSSQQDKFARGLYTLLSDEGVHALIAEREFARLLRNMVIEYGVMFLTMLEKKGIKIQP